jgi:hypothetical protein
MLHTELKRRYRDILRFAQPISEKTGFAVQYVIDSANGNRPITNDETQKILDALTGLVGLAPEAYQAGRRLWLLEGPKPKTTTTR